MASFNNSNSDFGLKSTWWARQGLNLRPHPCEGCALPLSYAPKSLFSKDFFRSPVAAKRE
jgi:hypothetical protein